MGLPREWPEVFDTMVDIMRENREREAAEVAEAERQAHRAALQAAARQQFGGKR